MLLLLFVGFANAGNVYKVFGAMNVTEWIQIGTLTAAACDVMAYTNGSLYCGTNGAGGGNFTNGTSITTADLKVSGNLNVEKLSTFENTTTMDMNGNNMAFLIDSESTTVDVMEIQSVVTTGIGFDLQCSSASFSSTEGCQRLLVNSAANTGIGLWLDQNGDGKGILIDSESTISTNYALQVEVSKGARGIAINQDNDTYGLFIDHDGDERAISIDSENVLQPAFQVDADAVTTGQAGIFDCGSASYTGTNGCLWVRQDHASATGTSLFVDQDATGAAKSLHIDTESTSGNAIEIDGSGDNVFTLDYYGNIIANKTNLTGWISSQTLTAADCDLKADTNGTFNCGIDAVNTTQEMFNVIDNGTWQRNLTAGANITISGNFIISLASNFVANFIGSHPNTNASSACSSGTYLGGADDGCKSFNESVLEITQSKTYNVTNYTIEAGTFTQGSLLAIQRAKEGSSLNITEGVGADPLTVFFNWTNAEITNFDFILMRVWYSGGLGHEIEVGLWGYTTNSYEEEYSSITDMAGFAYIEMPVKDGVDHVSSGLVSVRMRHVQNGNAAHVLRMDYIALVEGFSTSTNIKHDSMSDRDDKENHPWAMTADATLRNFTNNVITNDTFTGDLKSEYANITVNLTIGAYNIWDNGSGLCFVSC